MGTGDKTVVTRTPLRAMEAKGDKKAEYYIELLDGRFIVVTNEMQVKVEHNHRIKELFRCTT